MKGIIVSDYPFPDYEPATRASVINTCIKMKKYFDEHDSIMISVSGGSDSDCIVHLVCTYFPEYVKKCHFVFVNTGLEYDATKRHLNDLEQKYSIEIERIRGKSVVRAVRKYGVPILNKSKAKTLGEFLRRTKRGYYLVFEYKSDYYGFTEAERNLARYLDEHKIMVSAKCCEVSKKNPSHKYAKENGIDLTVTGIRKSEGGQRATTYKSCFQEYKKNYPAIFMPLFWWSDDVKDNFKRTEGIRFSDCYEVWGMKRTGCVGCPFGKNTAEELELMYQYEPRLYKACMSVFGTAYELTDRFHCRKKKCIPEFFQMSLTDEIRANGE